MKLAVSNLAFGELDAKLCKNLFESGVQGIEVAPSKIAPWHSLRDSQLRLYREMVEDAGLTVPSLQAIFYDVPSAQLLQGQEGFLAMLEQVKVVSNVAQNLGADVLVFGAPKNRTPDGKAVDDAWSLGIERFKLLAEVCKAEQIFIAIEPIPPIYGDTFLSNWRDVLSFVENVGSPHIMVHLDTACVMLADDRIDEAVRTCGQKVRHFHISEPHLAGFAQPAAEHESAAAALEGIDYDNWLAIEMLCREGDRDEQLEVAVSYVKATYGSRLHGGSSLAAGSIGNSCSE